MIRGLAALILLSTLSETTGIPQKIPLTVAELGDNLTLTCKISGDEAGLFYWYKLKFGYMVQTIAGGTLYKLTLKEQFNYSRFAVAKVNALYSLTIRNVSKDDEATYFCQAGAAYQMKFINGTVLVVKDHKNQQKSVYVKQIPETASVQPGDSVALQCSFLSKNKENCVQCPGEHRAYWFTAGSGESHPSIIYTHRNTTDKQEERSCVYRLSKTIKSSSDNGMYYCAVVQCGEILFGEGTKVETRQEVFLYVTVLGTLLACCVIGIVIAAIIIYRKQKPVCEHCKDLTASNPAEHDRSAEDHRNSVEGDEMSVNYAALDFISRKRDRSTNNRESSQDCIYSGMRGSR